MVVGGVWWVCVREECVVGVCEGGVCGVCVCKGVWGGGFLPKYLHWKNPFKMIISYKTSMFLYIKPSLVNMLKSQAGNAHLQLL